ncbi:hypothetical protein [Treponema sp.]
MWNEEAISSVVLPVSFVILYGTNGRARQQCKNYRHRIGRADEN